MSRLIGYVSVSSKEWHLNWQINALKRIGCSKELIFVDKLLKLSDERLEFKKCMRTLQPGDTLIVWRIDRIKKPITYLLKFIRSLYVLGIGFRSVQWSINTVNATPLGLQLICDELLKRAIKAKLEKKDIGRPRVDEQDPRIAIAKRMLSEGVSMNKIRRNLKISTLTLSRYLDNQCY